MLRIFFLSLSMVALSNHAKTELESIRLDPNSKQYEMRMEETRSTDDLHRGPIEKLYEALIALPSTETADGGVSVGLPAGTKIAGLSNWGLTLIKTVRKQEVGFSAFLPIAPVNFTAATKNSVARVEISDSSIARNYFLVMNQDNNNLFDRTEARIFNNAYSGPHGSIHVTRLSTTDYSHDSMQCTAVVDLNGEVVPTEEALQSYTLTNNYLIENAHFYCSIHFHGA